MSTRPRIIATTASAALLAATGAGAAVLAVDTVTADQTQTTAEANATDTLQAPQDDRTTVYRAPQGDDGEYDGQDDGSPGKIQPAPPTTSWNGGHGQQGPANTSKSS